MLIAAVLASLVSTGLIMGRLGEAADRPAGGPEREPVVDITEYGATAGDGLDDTLAIRRAIVKAKAAGWPVHVPPGTFRHNDILQLDGVSLTGNGPGSVLASTDPTRSAVQVTGANVSVRDLRLTSNATSRASKLEHHKLVFNKATGFTAERVQVVGSAAAGIFIYGGAHGLIRDNVVRDTQADGIHTTAAATDVLIKDNLVTGTGDDMIAVVSYGTGPQLVHKITIADNTLLANRAGRGIGLVGGADITVTGNTVKDPDMAGIYLASEASYGTNLLDDVTVADNTIVRAGSREPCDPPDKAGCGQGAIHVFANNQPITRVRFQRNQVLDSRIFAVHLNGVFAQYTNAQPQEVTFCDNRFAGAGADGLFVSDSFRGRARFLGNLIWDTKGLGLLYQKPAAGSTLQARGNVFGDVSSAGEQSVVKVEPGTADRIEISHNRHYAPRPVTYFLEEYVNAAQEDYSGNLSPYPSLTNGSPTPPGHLARADGRPLPRPCDDRDHGDPA